MSVYRIELEELIKDKKSESATDALKKYLALEDSVKQLIDEIHPLWKEVSGHWYTCERMYDWIMSLRSTTLDDWQDKDSIMKAEKKLFDYVWEARWWSHGSKRLRENVKTYDMLAVSFHYQPEKWREIATLTDRFYSILAKLSNLEEDFEKQYSNDQNWSDDEEDVEYIASKKSWFAKREACITNLKKLATMKDKIVAWIVKNDSSIEKKTIDYVKEQLHGDLALTEDHEPWWEPVKKKTT